MRENEYWSSWCRAKPIIVRPKKVSARGTSCPTSVYGVRVRSFLKKDIAFGPWMTRGCGRTFQAPRVVAVSWLAPVHASVRARDFGR